MKSLSLFGILLLAGSIAAYAAPQASPQIYGQYLESRDADVYTGPCFANSEVNLSGHEAILAWHIQQGTWNNVPLDGLSVIAVVRASGTLGDPYENPLPAKAILIVDQQANEEQRAALEGFAQAQAGALLADVVGVEALPVSFQIGSQHSFATLTAGDQLKLSTRAVVESDMICHNEEVFYPPLASHLTHSMPVVSSESSYRGAALGINWDESGRRGSFVGFFAD
jgi:hypothetical protein